MAFAYECCKANRGAAGVDGQTFEDIEEHGVKKWLDELTQELKSRTYRPQPGSLARPTPARMAPFFTGVNTSPPRHVRETRRTRLRDNLTGRVFGCHITSEHGATFGAVSGESLVIRQLTSPIVQSRSTSRLYED
jgi:hypothetical protein